MQLHACILLALACVVDSLSLPHSARCHRSRFRQTAFRHFATRDLDGFQSGKRLMIFGLGNVGRLVAQRSASLKVKGEPFFDQIYGTTRDDAKEIPGVEVIKFDAFKEIEKVLPRCTHVLVTIPPTDHTFDDTDKGTDEFTQLKYMANMFRRYLCDPVLHHPAFSVQNLIPAKTWVGYISSTAVYGNYDAEWVTESDSVKCKAGTKGELYHRCENEWRNAADVSGWRLHVFRAAGIYGKSASAIHTIRKMGAAAEATAAKDDESEVDLPTSRIHEEDLSRALLCTMMDKGGLTGDSKLWNLADDDPAPRAQVMAFAAQLLKEANTLSPPKHEDESQSAKSSERERRRSTDRKRVSNKRIKDILPDKKLLFPTYREGLQSVLDSNREEWSSKVQGAPELKETEKLETESPDTKVLK